MRFFYEKRDNTILVEKRRSLTFRRHIHPQIEMAVITKGWVDVGAGAETIRLFAGDSFIAFPNIIHWYGDQSEDIEAYFAILPADLFPEHSREFSDMNPKSCRVQGINDSVTPLFERIFNTNGKYANRASRALFSVILSDILEKCELVNTDSFDKSSIQNIVRYVCENYKSDITLEDISQNLFISRSRLSHLFSEKLGTTFRSFLNTVRLNDAEFLLKTTDKSITEIAELSGFENTRTFNRAFFKLFGSSPRDYRKKE